MKIANRPILFAFAATALLSVGEVHAQFHSFEELSATLTGSQEVPGVSTTATGSVRLVLRNYGPGQLTPAFDLQANFTGLTGGWTAAGLYGPADPGQTGPLIADFTSTLWQLPPGVTSGSFFVMDYWQISPAQIDALLAGKVYFNLRSTAFPGGEIRGQLFKEPAGPAGGTIALSPPSPVVPGTALAVTCNGWLDGSLPLAYEVLVDDVVVSARGASSSPSFTGPATFGTHSLKVRIYDSGNNVTEVTQNFTVGRVFTDTAGQATTTGATLNGTVNASGSTMDVFFDASIDGINFISFPAIPGTVTGSGNIAVTAALPNLAPNTAYYFRIRGVNSMETFSGGIRTFKTPSAGGLEFANANYIDFQGFNPSNPGAASPYPSIIPVSGISGNISSLRVKLNGFLHCCPDDIDILLMGPGGAVAAVMSDAGGTSGLYADLVFDETAAIAIPDELQITSGTYAPANYEPGEAVPPGGVGPIGTSLKALAAGGVNGEWKLFVTDDRRQDMGWIESWSLLIEPGSFHESWRRFYYGTAANAGNAADDFDYDKDGLTNLIEWACNLNPTSPGSLPMAVNRNAETIRLTYSRSVSAVHDGAVFAVEWTDTLTAGSWSAAAVPETILSDNGTLQIVEAIIPAGSANHRFVRLKVTGPCTASRSLFKSDSARDNCASGRAPARVIMSGMEKVQKFSFPVARDRGEFLPPRSSIHRKKMVRRNASAGGA